MKFLKLSAHKKVVEPETVSIKSLSSAASGVVRLSNVLRAASDCCNSTLSMTHYER